MGATELKILLPVPGVAWSIADVFDGIVCGLSHYGIEAIPARMDRALANGMSVRDASFAVVDHAVEEHVDVVLIVSGLTFHPDAVIALKRLRIPVVAILTESPYDLEHEMHLAGLLNGCWTTERSARGWILTEQPNVGYLRHAWRTDRHHPGVVEGVSAHDVVFVGSGFRERVTFLNAIDWSGIDLGLYGIWDDLGLKEQVQACIRGGTISNVQAADLYRNAKIGLNIYRYGGESLNPRAYELAACKTFQLSTQRAELEERFGLSVAVCESPEQAEHLIRMLLPNEVHRKEMARHARNRVSSDSWEIRALQILRDLSRWFDLPISLGDRLTPPVIEHVHANVPGSQVWPSPSPSGVLA